MDWLKKYNERKKASQYAESKCGMCLGRKNLPLEHCCGRIKDAFLEGFNLAMDLSKGVSETVWTCARCRYSWKSSEHNGPECARCYFALGLYKQK